MTAAQLHSFKVNINGRIIDSVVKEKNVARGEYAAAVSINVAAVLLEQERPNIFEVYLGAIPAGASVHNRFDLRCAVSNRRRKLIALCIATNCRATISTGSSIRKQPILLATISRAIHSAYELSMPECIIN